MVGSRFAAVPASRTVRTRSGATFPCSFPCRPVLCRESFRLKYTLVFIAGSVSGLAVKGFHGSDPPGFFTPSKRVGMLSHWGSQLGASQREALVRAPTQDFIGDRTMAAVDEKVKQIIVEQLQVDEAEVTPGASFQEDLGADSLDVVELVMQFEEAFDIQIPDEDAEKIKTVKDAIEYIEKHQKAK